MFEYCIQYAGGLGDIFNDIYRNRSKYNSVNALSDNDKMTIIVFCHNPFAVELFKWHPKQSQLNVLSPGWFSGNGCYHYRLHHKLCLAECSPKGNKASIVFYTSKEDKQVLQNLPKRYVVIAGSAGLPERYMPQGIIDDLVAKLAQKDIVTCGIGRTYKRSDRPQELTYRSPCINLVDRLSVPGVVTLVQGAMGVITSHSAIHSLSNQQSKLQLLLYPSSVRKRYDYWRGTKQGNIYTHGLYSEYNDELLNKFLQKVKDAYKI